MNRYQGLEIKNDQYGRRYYKDNKYPDIPLSSDDIYIITDFTDRLDLIAKDYYNDVSLWWVIAIANAEFMPSDTLYVPPATQLRIPTDIGSVIQAYNDLNSIT